MIGKRVAHYTVLETLGEGGMGVVYKALDTHLNRFVALKILSAEDGTDGAVRVTWQATVELETSEKPACIAEIVTLMLPEAR